jgi:nanoRNase/pAp phosphatase (c-di-AMP/oligoRNAs hydrolase)
MREVAFPEVIAEMADFLIQLQDIETVLSMGEYNNELILSLRTTRFDLNAGEMIKRIVEGRGTAGGHGMMAGGKIDDVPNERHAMSEVESFLTGRFLAEIGCEGVEPTSLIS